MLYLINLLLATMGPPLYMFALFELHESTCQDAVRPYQELLISTDIDM